MKPARPSVHQLLPFEPAFLAIASFQQPRVCPAYVQSAVRSMRIRRVNLRSNRYGLRETSSTQRLSVGGGTGRLSETETPPQSFGGVLRFHWVDGPASIT